MTFALAHPWMTFWLAVLLILCAENVGLSIAKALRRKADTQ